MRKLALTIIALIALAGCSSISPPSATPRGTARTEEVNLLKQRMNDAFAALEMYSADNSLKYPEKLDVLIPKYLDDIPVDPVSQQPIVYQKTEDGFFLGASGDYKSAGAEEGFPKMSQDGFYVKKAEEFPKEEND